jgi:hypothetical protein
MRVSLDLRWSRWSVSTKLSLHHSLHIQQFFIHAAGRLQKKVSVGKASI